MQAVGFSYGDQAETAGASDEAAGAGDAEPAAEAAGAGAPGGVPTVQPQPFVPRFEVPDDLRDSLPETERMHKVRGLFRITVTSDAQHQGLTAASGRHGVTGAARPVCCAPHSAAVQPHVDNSAPCLLCTWRVTSLLAPPDPTFRCMFHLTPDTETGSILG